MTAWYESFIDWDLWKAKVAAWNAGQSAEEVEATCQRTVTVLLDTSRLLTRAAPLLRTGEDELRWQQARARWARLIAPILADTQQSPPAAERGVGALPVVVAIAAGVVLTTWGIAWCVRGTTEAEAEANNRETALLLRETEIRWEAAQRGLHLDPATVNRRREDGGDDGGGLGGLLGLLGLGAVVGAGLWLWRAR